MDCTVHANTGTAETHVPGQVRSDEAVQFGRTASEKYASCMKREQCVGNEDHP